MKHKEQYYQRYYSFKRYYLLTVEMKLYHVMIDGQKCFDGSAKHKLMTYDNIQRIATGQGDDYTTGCLLDWNYVKNYHKMIIIDLSKQHALMMIQSNATN